MAHVGKGEGGGRKMGILSKGGKGARVALVQRG